MVDRESSQPVLTIPEDLDPLQVRCRLDHSIACMLLLKISEMRHGYNIIDTDKLLIEDSLQQVELQLRLTALLYQQFVFVNNVEELFLR